MSKFTTKVTLLQEQCLVEELKVKHFKILLKTLLGDEPDINDVFTNLLNILKETTCLTKNELKNLSAIDFLLLILQQRCISIGNTIQLEVTNNTNTKITLNLSKVIETLKQSINFNFTQTIENLKIEYKLLSIYDFLFSTQKKDKLLFLKSYIKRIYLTNNECIEITSLSDDNFLQLIKALPANYSATIFKYITKLIQQHKQINLLNYINNENLTLYFNQHTFTFILQILFSKNLLPLYENIFALAKFANLSPEYIEECTPGEYTIFVKILERVLKEQNSQLKSSNSLPPINADTPNFM